MAEFEYTKGMLEQLDTDSLLAVRQSVLNKGYRNGDIETPSGHRQFMYGFDSATNDLQDLGGFVSDWSHVTSDLFTSVHNLVAKDQLPMGADMSPEQKVAMHDAKQKQRLQERQLSIQKEYGDVWGTKYADTMTAHVGGFSKMMASTSTLVPIGAGWKTAAALGAGIGAWDVTLKELANNKEVDTEMIALAMGMGAVIAPLIAVGGKAFVGWLHSKIKDGVPVTIDDIMDYSKAKMVPIDEEQAGKLALHINTKASLVANPNAVKGVPEEAITAAKDKAEREVLQAKAADRRTTYRTDYTQQQMAKGKVSISNSVRKTKDVIEETQGLDRPMSKATRRGGGDPLLRGAMGLAHKKARREDARAAYSNDEEYTAFYNTYVKATELQTDMETAWVNNRRAMRDPARNKPGDIEQAYQGRYRAMDDRKIAQDQDLNRMFDENERLKVARQEVESDLGYSFHRALRFAPIKTKIEHKYKGQEKFFAKGESNPIMKEALRAAINKTAISANRDTLRLKPKLKSSLNTMASKQKGAASTDLLANIGIGIGAATIGAAANGEEGAIMALLLAGGAKYGAGRLARLGKLGDNPGQLNASKLREILPFVTRTKQQLSRYGTAGKELGYLMEEAERNIKHRMGKIMLEIDHRLTGLSEGQKAMIPKIMRGEAKATDRAVAKVTREIKRDFNEVLREASKAGIITVKAASKMMKKGYWPRVYDDLILGTKEGEEKFIKTLMGDTGTGFSTRAAAENAVSTILMKEDLDISKLITTKNTKTGKVYVMTREAAQRFANARKSFKPSEQAKHLRARGINVKDEALLDEFLVQDPHRVLTEYFNDVIKSVEFAKVFGGDDALSHKIIANIRKEAGTHAGDYAQNAYWHAVNDSRATELSKYMSLNNSLLDAYGRVNAFETLHLTLASVSNLSQAIVAGSTTAIAEHGLVKGMRIFAKGIRTSLTKMGREDARRSGAAIESTIMQVLAEGSIHQGWMSRGLVARVPILNYINNPAKFLEAMQFVRSENMNRILGANFGRAHLEQLQSDWAKVEAGMIKGKKADKIMSNIKSQFKDAHISMPRSSTDINDHAVDQMMLHFSDKINFTNDVTRIPPAWRSPNMRLVMKFKSFVFQQGAFIKDGVAGNWAKGDKAKAIRFMLSYGTVGTTVGMGVDEVRRFITADDSEFTQTQRLMRGFSAVGGLGIMWDTVKAVTTDYAGAAFSLAGPAAGDLYRLGKGLKSTGTHLLTDGPAASDLGPLAGAMVGVTGGGYPYKKDLVANLVGMADEKKRMNAKHRGARGFGGTTRGKRGISGGSR